MSTPLFVENAKLGTKSLAENEDVVFATSLILKHINILERNAFGVGFNSFRRSSNELLYMFWICSMFFILYLFHVVCIYRLSLPVIRLE